LADSLTGRTPAYVAALGERNRLLAELRRRGSRGGVIPLHRAMLSGRLTPALVLSAVIIPFLLAVLVLLALRPVGDLWVAALSTLQGVLGLPGDVAVHTVPLGRVFSFSIPYLTTAASLPSVREYVTIGAVCAVVMIASWVLPQRFLPVAYYLRFGTLVQLTAFLYFAIRPDFFPYELPAYLESLFEIGAAVLVLVPVVYGLTLYPFDIAIWRKVLLTLAAVVHLAVLVPLQGAIHAYAIHHLSLLVMPSMFFLWGILPHVFVIVSLYGLGMSWPDAQARDRQERPAVARP